MPDILTIGEALIDFVSTEAKVTLRGAQAFKKMAGGAPVKVAVGLSRLGVSSGFTGRVGDDPFGHFLADTLATAGVDVSQLNHSPPEKPLPGDPAHRSTRRSRRTSG